MAPADPPAPLHRNAPWLALGLGVVVQGAVALRWIGLEQRVGEPVVCEAIQPVNTLITLVHQGGLGLDELLNSSLLAGLGVMGHGLFGGGGASLLLTMLACMLLCQFLIFDCGRLLAGPWAGVLAALLLPMLPDVALLGRRWGPILPQLTLLLAMADLLLRSRSLSRSGLALVVGLLGAAGVVLSPFSTHNLIFVAAACSLCAGPLLRGLLLGRAAFGVEPGVSRARVAVGGLLALGPALLVAWSWLLIRTNTDYIAAEAHAAEYAGSIWDPAVLFAYPRLLVTSSAGPLLGVLAALGLLGVLWRGRGRAELLFWLLGPIVPLSLIAKKNWYYAAVVFPVLPLLVALGLALLPWRRVAFAMGALLLAATGWAFWQASFVPGGTPAWYRYTLPDGAFQTQPGTSLTPEPWSRHQRHTALLRAALPGSSCPEGVTVGQLPDGYANDMVFALKDLDPCLDFRLHAETRDFDWLFIGDFHCTPRPERAPGPPPEDAPRPFQVARCELHQSCEVVSLDATEAPCLWLLRYGVTVPDTP